MGHLHQRQFAEPDHHRQRAPQCRGTHDRQRAGARSLDNSFGLPPGPPGGAPSDEPGRWVPMQRPMKHAHTLEGEMLAFTKIDLALPILAISLFGLSAARAADTTIDQMPA